MTFSVCRRYNEAMAQSLLIRGGQIADGTGAKLHRADIRITGNRITNVKPGLAPLSGETVIDAGGRVVAPGFIDAHSHADGGLLEEPEAETQIRQGITTSIVGQDGGHNFPLAPWFDKVQARKTTLNIASFVGHGTVRGQVMGKDYKRPSRPEEVRAMQALVVQEMRAGGLGLSSGLEYDPGIYAETSEIIALAQAAAPHGGMYISHVRDEEDDALKSFAELIRVAQGARCPAQISHIKLASAPVWNKANQVIKMMNDAKARGLDISADIYPYTYWQSSIIVLREDRNFDDRAGWEKGLAGIGGAQQVILSTYEPQPAWAGKTLTEIAALTGKDPVSVIQMVVAATWKTDGTRIAGESVVVTAMQEQDVAGFMRDRRVMFCTDGGLHGTHPRGAGSYPRILGVYVREKKVLSLEDAVHKASGLPASRFGLREIGTIASGKYADLVLFDPRTIHDTATVQTPQAKPIGLDDVIVSGTPVLRNGKLTSARPGRILRRTTR